MVGVNMQAQSFNIFNHKKACYIKGLVPTPQNKKGLAKRKHRHVVETAITLLQTAHLFTKFWFHACAAAIYLINKMPCAVLKMKSPYQLLFHKISDISHLKIFGCACFPLITPYSSSKLQPKTKTCVFLGYADHYKGFICLDIITQGIYISRYVLFDETTFPYFNAAPLPNLPVSSPAISHEHSPNPTIASISLQNQVVSHVSHTHSSTSTATHPLNLHSSSASNSLTASRASYSLDALAFSDSRVYSFPFTKH